jgi:charged multivesicular body protein 1
MSTQKMENNLFNLKFAAKQLERSSKKAEKDEKTEKMKCKKAIQKGNIEGAKIHAENAIRQKSQALNYLRMAARVDAVASRVQTAVTTKKVMKSMGEVTKAMDSAMKSMSLEQISKIMDNFEKQFEDLDVQSSYMENTMGNTVTASVPQNDVDNLMQQVADEAGLELNMELPGAQTGTIGTATATAASVEQDDLSQRLAKLRQM